MNVVGSFPAGGSTGSHLKKHHRIKVEGEYNNDYNDGTPSSSNRYNNINLFYDRVPDYELTLDEFECYALKRLRVLRKIDQLQLMKQRYKPDEIRKVINDTLKKEGLYDFIGTNSTVNSQQQQRNSSIDEISHYILRISYCQTEELRKWFLQMECELLRHRLFMLTQQQQGQESSSSSSSTNATTSLSIQKILSSIPSLRHLRPISSQMKSELATPLQQLLDCSSTYSSTSTNTLSSSSSSTPQQPTVSETKFYSVPFLDAIDIIGRRECYLYMGQAYITQSKLMAIVLQKFRTQLSYTLHYMSYQSNALFTSSSSSTSSPTTTSANAAVVSPTSSSSSNTNVAERARLEPFLKNINRCLTNPTNDGNGTEFDVSGDTTTITAHNLLQYKNNMPLCMRQLQVGLQHDHKLKHWGRLQYGLFLKGAGLSMEDAILFFQKHFTAVTNEQFQKEYAYNIRHMYGKEGKRASYTPYNCTKIILGNSPNTQSEHHGCPYKHYDVQQLDQVLQEIHISNVGDRNSIIKLKTSHQYQLACMKQFEIQHGPYMKQQQPSADTNVLDNVGNHPNAWFRASIHYTHQQQNQND